MLMACTHAGGNEEQCLQPRVSKAVEVAGFFLFFYIKSLFSLFPSNPCIPVDGHGELQPNK